MSRDVGTLLYNAPEVLSRQAYGAAIDVYSFGIVMWEIYTRLQPYDDQVLPVFYADLIDMICVRRVRPTIPPGCPEGWKELMEECWSHNSKDRSMFQAIVPKIDRMISEFS
jgi:serine/threonine protein kinase